MLYNVSQPSRCHIYQMISRYFSWSYLNSCYVLISDFMIMNSYATFHNLWIHMWIHVYEAHREIIPEIMGTKVPDVGPATRAAWQRRASILWSLSRTRSAEIHQRIVTFNFRFSDTQAQTSPSVRHCPSAGSLRFRISWAPDRDPGPAIQLEETQAQWDSDSWARPIIEQTRSPGHLSSHGHQVWIRLGAARRCQTSKSGWPAGELGICQWTRNFWAWSGPGSGGAWDGFNEPVTHNLKDIDHDCDCRDATRRRWSNRRCSPQYYRHNGCQRYRSGRVQTQHINWWHNQARIQVRSYYELEEEE